MANNNSGKTSEHNFKMHLPTCFSLKGVYVFFVVFIDNVVITEIIV